VNIFTLAISENLDDFNHVILAPASELILEDDELDDNDEPKEE